MKRTARIFGPLNTKTPKGKAALAISYQRRFTFTAPPLEGLGTDLATLKRMCADNPRVLDALDQVSVAGPGNVTGNNQYTVEQSGIDNNIHNSKDRESPTGTSREAALRKLRKGGDAGERRRAHSRGLHCAPFCGQY